MTRNFVNLNINPCKMCMPMGGVMAFKGIEKAVTILHGSQGCSTYIRRHMATHYNEPIDIASTSLSETGTVYGGAENLKLGIRNVVAVYQPEVVGVLTTCLAETIGEDVERIIAELYAEDRTLRRIKIIPVSTPGYGSTQTEGYYKALRAVVERILEPREIPLRGRTPKQRKKSRLRINVIPANLNPGDIREIKQILDDFGLEYILLPDVSLTLDAPFQPEYRRIPEGGTKLGDIKAMAEAAATIEMGITVDDSLSPGAYLRDKFGIPLYRCAIPSGLVNTDGFLEILAELSGKRIPEKYIQERGRLLDAMIDAHKFNAQARAVIYGDAEQVLSLTGVCLENGIKPVLLAVGGENKPFKNAVIRLLAGKEIVPDEAVLAVPGSKNVSPGYEGTLILDDTDFETIGRYAVERKANLLIGNSDGRRIAEKHGLELIRIGFPIHDRVGGQRKHYTGYSGTTALIEETANSILAAKEQGYRQEMYERFYPKSPGIEEKGGSSVKKLRSRKAKGLRIKEVKELTIREVKELRTKEEKEPKIKGEEKIKLKGGDVTGLNSPKVQIMGGAKEQAVNSGVDLKLKVKTHEDKAAGHPCFNARAQNIARMHLPVAPACNISCNYCSRKYDCPNESRPGVTSQVLTPEEALERFKLAREKIPNLRIIGIAGPGDALANFPETARTLELIRKEDPTVTFCLSTNGLMLPFYSAELLKLGVTHVTITINAVDPGIGAKIYHSVNYLGKTYTAEEGASLLLHNQLSGLRFLSSQGVVCKVNIVMVKGVNDAHVPEVVQKVKEYGAYITNIMKMIPAPGSRFEHLPSVSHAELVGMRKHCETYMKQMHHCRQCRADAVGLLSNDRSREFGCKSCAPAEVVG